MSSRTNIALSVRGLSKAYSIAHEQEKHPTLAETLLHRVRQPFRRAAKETFWALKDVSFDIQKGDVVGVIGRNGAGKSTLLKILSRITEPTSGVIKLYGRIGSLLEVGTGFHPELTGRENIYLNGQILGMRRKEIDKQFDAIVDFSGVEKFLDTPVKRYSSGMYVRLAFAVAAHLQTEILIIDEVLAVGDVEFQKKCMGKMKDVSTNEGRTVLFVSHNLSALESLCKSAILLRAGTVDTTGGIHDVISRYFSDASDNANGQFDLRSHPARARGYDPLITEVRTLRSDGRASGEFFATGTMTIEIDIAPKNIIHEPRVAIAIEDQSGRRIMTTATYFSARPFHKEGAEQFTARCVIPKLNLGEGRYLISVSCSDKLAGMLDSVDGAAWIDIKWDNAYQSSEAYNPVYGPVLCNADWSVKND